MKKRPVWEDRSMLLPHELDIIEELEKGAAQQVFIDINERNEVVELSTIDCGIKKIPENIDRLISLESLDIRDKKISKLDRER